MAPSTIKLADYLFTRLRQLGVQSIHGVPGDYNLTLLDYVEPAGLHWVGNCNELNAGYAADAYSRVKGLGALITTFGVGELSAANAVAGAYAELAPLVHIVGTPARPSQESRALIHHTFSDGDYTRFARVAENITIAQANLIDPRTCPELIDATIQQCLIHSRPVYIQLPVDMVAAQVSADRLQTPIEIPTLTGSLDWDAAIDAVLERIYSCRQPAILVDGESKVYRILDELHDFIKKSGWPTWVTAFSKGYIDEALPNVHGVWKGPNASAEEKQYFNSCDLILCFGPHFSNTNTSIFAAIPERAVTVLVGARSVESKGKVYRDVPMKDFFNSLLGKLDMSRLDRPNTLSITADTTFPTPWISEPDALPTQALFYKTLNQYLRPGDIILAETGTAGYGSHEFRLPTGSQLFCPVTWLSIGYMLPAAQGAALAQRELHSAGKWPQEAQTNPSQSQPQSHSPRTVLIIGDGSFQMTVQEVSTIIRERLNVLIVLINNDGYTIERCLHGYQQQYNDVAPWRYTEAPSFFGASKDKTNGYHSQVARAATWKELHQHLEEADRSSSEKPTLNMVEVLMDRNDAPAILLPYLNAQTEKAPAANGT